MLRDRPLEVAQRPRGQLRLKGGHNGGELRLQRGGREAVCVCVCVGMIELGRQTVIAKASS